MSQSPPPDTFLRESKDRSISFFENHPHLYRVSRAGAAALLLIGIGGGIKLGLDAVEGAVHYEPIATGTYDLMQGETPVHMLGRSVEDLGTINGIPTKGLDTVTAAQSLPGGDLQPGSTYDISIVKNSYGQLGVRAEPADESK